MAGAARMKLTPRTGRVIDREQEPVTGALVAVEWGTAPTPEIAIETDEEGRFRIVLPEGRFRIGAHGPDDSAGTFETEGDAEDEEILIELASPKGPDK